MKILNLKQGTPEWHKHRATSHNASDAPAMQGASKYKRRAELVRERATGITPEIDAATQRLFDRGHAAEAAMRPVAERVAGDELFPVIATTDDGYLSASFDGLTMDRRIGWEHKIWNAEKAGAVQNGRVPETDRDQLIQQFAVSGADTILYMLSDGTEGSMTYLWVPRGSLAKDGESELRAGWKQFDEDAEAYRQSPPAESEPEPVANGVTDLPAVRVQVTGELSIQDNFNAFEDQLDHFLDRVLIREPENDQDFADLESQIKTLKQAEKALDEAGNQILSQVEAVDLANKRKEQLHKLVRDNRLMAEKLVKSRKQALRENILRQARENFIGYVAYINASISEQAGKPVSLSLQGPDFIAAIKGKKTIKGLCDAADDALAKGKIEANEEAERLRNNLTILANIAKDHRELFADWRELIDKNPEDMEAAVKLRIVENTERKRKQAEAEKEEREKQAKETAERERERIRAEEEAKVKQEAERKQAEIKLAPNKQAVSAKSGNGSVFDDALAAWAKDNRVSKKAMRDLYDILNEWIQETTND